MVYSSHVSKLDTEANVDSGQLKSRKAYRKELKRTRQDAGDAASGEFQGPWAMYEGMENFKAQKADLSEDQKELMQRYEEMRKQRLEEAKTKDRTGDGEPEVHKSTTVFHGAGH